jgi:hypothetical protein
MSLLYDQVYRACAHTFARHHSRPTRVFVRWNPFVASCLSSSSA